MLHAVLVSLALVSGAAPGEVRSPIDVSLRPGSRELPTAAALPSATAALWRDGQISSVDARYGVPNFFWAPRDGHGAFRAMGLTAEQAARRHLMVLAPLYRLAPNQLIEAKLAALHDVGQGAIIARFELPFAGVKLFRDELKLVLDRGLDLVAVSGALSPDRKPTGSFDLLDRTALSVAYSDLTGRALDAGTLGPARSQAGGYTFYSLAGQGTSPRVRTVYFPTPEGLEPAYHLELHVGDADSTEARYAAYVISARDGRILFRQDLTRADSFGYRVWADAQAPFLPLDGPHGNAFSPHPTGTAAPLALTFVAPTVTTLPNAGLSTNDPWLAPDATDTRGNNAQAYADLAAPNGYSSGDVLATLTGPLLFDRVYDTSLNPDANAEQIKAAVTQLFYDVNVFHDWFYDVGFDERAGNGQKSNFGRGGLGNDALDAQAQDYSGRNNANMSTPSDGASPQMQMYVFDGGAGAKIAIPGVKTFRTGTATFGPASFTRTGELVLVDDGVGTVTDGCTANFNNVAGKIVLIDRGTCTFATKVQNAQSNGALGVIIGNNQGGGAPDLAGQSATITIPALSLSRTDTQDLKARLQAGSVTITLDRPQVVDRDGTIDNAIVAHEWGHYISNRLISDGNGLANTQGVGMGEGWADFHAMLMIVKASDRLLAGNDQYQGVYPMAVYTSEGLDPLGTYFGIRRVPYSTDFSKDALTFKHVQDRVALPAVPTAYGQNGADNSEVHNTGEVWATMLWECYAGLLRDPRFSFAQAQDRMKRYLVAGYKLTPVVPTMVEARDALLAAAAANDLQDFATFSAAFARRGMGQKAVAPDRDSTDNTPVVESFLTGNAVEIACRRATATGTSMPRRPGASPCA
jgi:large repetitive protein